MICCFCNYLDLENTQSFEIYEHYERGDFVLINERAEIALVINRVLEKVK